MKELYLKIILLMVVFNMITIGIFFCYKIEGEKQYALAQKNNQEASAYKLEAEKLYAKAMEEKAEAERCRKDYYARVFYYDENGTPCALYAQN